MPKSVLVIVAHADDMEFMAGGTIARMADLGYSIREVIATNNERGTLEPDWSPQFTADARRAEARLGARALGVDPDVEFLGYEDGRLSETPLNELREKCMRAIRRHRPDVLFTWDPHAAYEDHQDHRAVAWRNRSRHVPHFPLDHPEHRDEGLELHDVGERYYFAKSPRDANKAVDISDYIGRKIDALCEHVCQMEMTVADLKLQLAASALDIPLIANADPKDFRPVIEAQIKAWAASVGRRHGVAYAEELRRTRSDGIERWARGSGSELPDDL